MILIKGAGYAVVLRTVFAVPIAFAIMLFLSSCFAQYWRADANAVFVGGWHAGYVQSDSAQYLTGERLLHDAARRIEAAMSLDSIIPNETVSIFPARVVPGKIVSINAMLDRIASSLTYDVNAVALYVHGQRKALFRSERDFTRLVSMLAAPWWTEYTVEAVIASDHELRTVRISGDTDFDTWELAFDRISRNAVLIHTVERGDYLFRIAKRYEVTIDDILRQNIGMTNNLAIGQRLLIPTTVPLVNIRTTDLRRVQLQNAPADTLWEERIVRINGVDVFYELIQVQPSEDQLGQ